MPAQRTGWHDSAPNGDSDHSRRMTRKGRFALWSFIYLIAAWLPTFGVHAEENTGLSGGSLSLATVSLNLAFVSSSTFNSKERTVRLGFDSRFAANLKELVAERELNSPLPKSLLRKQLVWVNEPRAKIRPGFGEFFRGET